MRTGTTKSTLLAAAVAAALLGSGSALADGGRHQDGWKSGGHQRGHSQQLDYGKRHHKRYEKRSYGHNDRGHYRKHRGGHHDNVYYRRPHGGRYVTNVYEYDDDDNDDDLLIGLAIGGLIGYAINQGGYDY